eukprot:TRINITY_DN3202_c0_g1_i8.p1 TRINITY_DN3202_c0_g1~~TRINITY_DN3202_c0_g1_i8.p1  ORF type:complete len:637 (+),score=67.58 TRINITY_DN3202_c0_g1_i8:1652-3562(+)
MRGAQKVERERVARVQTESIPGFAWIQLPIQGDVREINVYFLIAVSLGKCSDIFLFAQKMPPNKSKKQRTIGQEDFKKELEERKKNLDERMNRELQGIEKLDLPKRLATLAGIEKEYGRLSISVPSKVQNAINDEVNNLKKYLDSTKGNSVKSRTAILEEFINNARLLPKSAISVVEQYNRELQDAVSPKGSPKLKEEEKHPLPEEDEKMSEKRLISEEELEDEISRIRSEVKSHTTLDDKSTVFATLLSTLYNNYNMSEDDLAKLTALYEELFPITPTDTGLDSQKFSRDENSKPIQPMKRSQPDRPAPEQKMLDVDFESQVKHDLNTTLADKTILLDEIDRETAKVPDVKLKQKDIPKSLKEFIVDANGDYKKEKVQLLMNQMSNDDIIRLFGKEHLDVYMEMKRTYENKVKELKRAGQDVKATAGKFRRLVLDLPHVYDAFLKRTDIMKDMFDRYVEKAKEYNKKLVEKGSEIKAKKQASKITSKARRKFIGALLTKVTPDEYRKVLQEFNDKDKGKGLQDFASLVPGRMVQELERQAFESSNNKEVAQVLKNPDAYKADDVSEGYKNLIKKYEEEVGKLPPEQRNADPRYNEFVKPYTEYKATEAELINMLRTKLTNGASKEEIANILKQNP